jgi:hypothetical protein
VRFDEYSVPQFHLVLKLPVSLGNVHADDPVPALFTDTSPEATAYWAKQITDSDTAAFATPPQYAAWRHIPRTYLMGEQDMRLPTFMQEDMAKLVHGKVKARRIRNGHSKC